jgi:hypothetical protein
VNLSGQSSPNQNQRLKAKSKVLKLDEKQQKYPQNWPNFAAVQFCGLILL